MNEDLDALADPVVKQIGAKVHGYPDNQGVLARNGADDWVHGWAGREAHL